MKCVSGTFNGTGAAAYLCFGFEPDYFKLIAGEDADIAVLEWARDMRCAEIGRGIVYVGSTNATQQAAQTVADTGVQTYEGGDILTTSNQTSVAYGNGVYLGWDKTDYRDDTTNGVVSAIDTWTFVTGLTGYFNADVLNGLAAVVGSGTGAGRIGEGSKIIIEETVSGKLKRTFIEAAGNGGLDAGGASAEITLNKIVQSGKVRYIGGAFDLAPIPVGQSTPAGVYLDYYTYVNVNDELQTFIAMQFDN